MFVRSRIVLVDDRREHLNGIKEALNALRLDCHAMHYDVESVGEWKKLPGTRILFIDKNLRPGVTMGAGSQDSFAAIAEVIELLISPDSGPYGLVLWAEEPDLRGLQTFLYERLSKEDPNLLPVFFAELRKSDFLDAAYNPVSPVAFQEAIVQRLSANAQMRALLTWEADVTAAADAVLRSVVSLVPPDARASEHFSSELGKILHRLSQAGAGFNRATESPREAINRVLVPILADRITEHDPDSGGAFDWREALEDPTEPPSIQAQAAVNSAIHLSFAKSTGSAPILPTELGAVVNFPFENKEEALTEAFGISEAEIRDDLLKMNLEEWQDCTLKLVQIGASCDNAQPKPGPLLYLLAVEWVFSAEDGTKTDGKPSLCAKKRKRANSDGEWLSPILRFDSSKNPGRISVLKNISLSVPKAKAKDWSTAYRLRDELISELTQEYARHISRPGIVTLPS